MLAAPLQILLAITPILVLKFVPSSWLIPNRLLELAMIGYLASLAVILRTFPNYAERFVGLASMARRFLVNVTRINWMFPVLILWLVGRIIVGVAFDLMQPDLQQWQQIALEKSIIETLIPVNVEVPETSFLDLLVALAVLPLATFTTMAVLGGGRYDLPDWLVNSDEKWVKIDDDEQDGLLLEDGNQSEEVEDESNGEKDGVTDDENSSLVKGNKSEVLSALAKSKEKVISIFDDD